jgi:PKD repeat protein
MLTRSPHRATARRAALAAALATVLAPSAALATPPGGNGDLLSNQRESGSYELYDPTLAPEDQQPTFWGGAEQRGLARSSPDGVHVAYWSGDDAGIDYGDADGTKIRKLTSSIGVRGIVFSPDGTKVAYTQDDHIFTIPVDGSAGPVQLGGTFNGAGGIEWAPDNSAIVVSAAGVGGDRDLFTVDPVTGGGHPLTATAGLDEDEPSLSPDGTRLAFTAQDDIDAHDRIDIMNLDGGDRHTLLTEKGADWPQWAPDGTRLAFTTESGIPIATIKPDGTGRHDVASAPVTQLSWLIARGTGNKAPVAAFTVAPAQPFTGGDTTLTSTATDPDGSIASEQWDLDGDGAYDDATGHVAHVTFATGGPHTVRLKVKDNAGASATSEQALTVLPAGRPGAKFTVDPTTPVLNQPATFTAAENTDPKAHVVHHQWDFDNDGTFDADSGETRTVQHIYTKIGSYTAKLRVTDAEGDHDETTLVFDVRDEVRCGVEKVGRITLDGCLTVKGQRRVAPNGVTINGFTLGGTPDGAQVAIDVTGGRLFTLDGSQVQAFLDGAINAPAGTVPQVPVSSCGEALGASRPNLASFTNSPELDFTLASDKTFAGLAPRGASKLKFDDNGTGHFDVSGLFPRLLLNWTAEANGSYTTNTDCQQRKLAVTVQSFFGRIVTMPQIRLERTGDDRWDGIADVRFGTFQTLPSAQAKATVRAGRISSVRLDFADVPLTPGLRLKASNLTLRLDKGQEELSGQAEITSYPAFFKQTVAYARGSIRLNGTDGLHLEGLVKIMGQDLGWGWLDITDHSIDAGIEAELHLGPAYAKAEISGYVGWSPFAFELLGRAEIGIKGIGSLSGSLLISSKGIAACGKFGFVDPGFSYRYGDDWPTVFLDSCDFGGLRVARASSATASAAAAKSRTVRVAGGQRAVVIVAKGRPGRAPRVTFTGPHGQRITSKANGQATRTSRFLLIPNKQDGTTNLMVIKPAAGTWRVRSVDGRAIKRVGTANALPEPSVKVKRDKKRKRLTWTLRPIKGQTVKLAEQNATGKAVRQIKATNKAKGTLKYAPTAGATKVVAQVFQNGLLRETKTVVKLR